jgi:O-glycosyl hydrolase
MKKTVILSGLVCAACAACSPGGGQQAMEKITVINGAVPAYRFTLPDGESFGNYTRIIARFLVDDENYGKSARARAYGNYGQDDFSDSGGIAFIDFGGGQTDRNGPYIVSNVIGSNVDLDTLSGSAGANEWFTLEFPLYGKRHQNYNAGHFPEADAGGDFYFCAGLGTGDASAGFTYYVKDVELVSDDGTRRIQADIPVPPAFAGYSNGMALLRREAVNRVEKTAPLREKGGPVEITVDSGEQHQSIAGFGGMSNAWDSPALTADDIDALYGNGGLGFNIFRIIVYHDPAQWGGLVETAKLAQGHGAFILASPWTPPPELKSNNSPVGGHLLPQNYARYAEHLGAFVQYMADNGVTINALSFQNEPDIKVNYDSCDWTAKQMLEFVRDYGRAIGNVKIIPGESFQFRREFTDPMLNDPLAVNKFDIVGGHVYGGGLAPYPLALKKGKEVWMTEHLFNTHGNYAYDLTWKAALTVAKEIHDCMNADFSAYIWWYLKRFYGMIGDGENGSVEGEVLRRGYVLSHYAKYASGVRIGAKAKGNPAVFATAYQSEGSVNLVIINMGGTASKAKIVLPRSVRQGSGIASDEAGMMRQAEIKFSGGGKTAALTLAPQSIVSIHCFLEK